MFASVGEHFSKNSKFWKFRPILALTKFCLLDYRFIPTVQWEKNSKSEKIFFQNVSKNFQKFFKKCQESFSWPTHKKSGSLSGGEALPPPSAADESHETSNWAGGVMDFLEKKGLLGTFYFDPKNHFHFTTFFYLLVKECFTVVNV